FIVPPNTEFYTLSLHDALPIFAYPTMIVNLLPRGLVGLMIAALLAALMGAMSSVFNSASTMVTLDFYKKFRPAATESQLVFFGRDRKSTRLNSSHRTISYAVFC